MVSTAAFALVSSFTPFAAPNCSSVCVPGHTSVRTPRMAAADIPSILQEIIARKGDEVAALRASLSSDQVLSDIMAKRANGGYSRTYNFKNSLDLPNNTLAVIAEIKRKSPSKGHLATLRDPTQIARVYHDSGAAAISVLTDYPGFGGTLDDLRNVAASQQKNFGSYPGPCPVLRKDFIIDEIQLAEAVSANADAVLLIVSALGKDKLKELIVASQEYGLDALVEVHNAEELETALECGAEIVGVNNRNLSTFEENLDNSIKLKEMIPDTVVSVAESGITECLDAWKFRDAGFNAILVGEALVKAYEGSSDTANGYGGGYNQARGLIKAFKSKGSTVFGRTANAAFFGKGEGAKETLGEISI